MHTTEQRQAVESRLAGLLPGLRPPAGLVRRLAEALTGEPVVMGVADLRCLGFGAYEGQVCLVTATRVLLATGTRVADPEHAFVLEQWDRGVAPMRRLFAVRPRVPLPDEV